MYEKNLSSILEQYIKRFDELNDPNGDDEGYKWRAVSCFKEHWNIDATDFTTMFKNSIKDLSNLIDNKTVQPLGGILMLLNHPEEVEFVREAFRKLFSDDYGDIDARQGRIYDFMEAINARIEKYASGSWKYPQQINNVIYYLNLWRPEDNYIFKATEATDWANCIEFGEDFGSGETFSLRKYYRMCDELLNEVSKNSEIIKLHSARFKKEARGYDDQMHILVYDIMYCSYHHGFYTSAVAATTSTKKRIENAKLRLACEQEKLRLEQLTSRKENIISELKTTIDLTGIQVSHKLWKSGTVLTHCANGLEIEFAIGIKKFQYPNAFIDGFLIAKDDSILVAIEKEYQQLKTVKQLEDQITNSGKEYNRLLELLTIK